MLSRVCEPPAEDPKLEAALYRDMDHSDVNRCFVADLLSGGPVGPRVIDLGCGPALIPILLCEHVSQLDLDGVCHVEVMGVDNCVAMLELARMEIELAGRLKEIHLQQIELNDAEALQENLADTVISNTVLHHLDDPSSALKLAVRALRPSGRLFIRDLVRPQTEADVERLVALHGGTACGDPTDTSPSQLLRQSFHASLTLGEIRELVSSVGIGPECVNMTSDRHWTLDCRQVKNS